MAGASLDIQLTISNAAEVKAAFESLQAKLADLNQALKAGQICPATVEFYRAG